jgi:hypothetical protein
MRASVIGFATASSPENRLERLLTAGAENAVREQGKDRLKRYREMAFAPTTANMANAF